MTGPLGVDLVVIVRTRRLDQPGDMDHGIAFRKAIPPFRNIFKRTLDGLNTPSAKRLPFFGRSNETDYLVPLFTQLSHERTSNKACRPGEKYFHLSLCPCVLMSLCPSDSQTYGHTDIRTVIFHRPGISCRGFP